MNRFRTLFHSLNSIDLMGIQWAERWTGTAIELYGLIGQHPNSIYVNAKIEPKYIVATNDCGWLVPQLGSTCALRILFSKKKKKKLVQYEVELFIYDLLECMHKSQYLLVSALATTSVAIRFTWNGYTDTLVQHAVDARDRITHDYCLSCLL